MTDSSTPGGTANATSAGLPAPGSTERTTIRRIPECTVNDREVAYRILDAGFVAHVAVVDTDTAADTTAGAAGGQPFVVPVGYARDGDHVLFHGSTGSRLFRGLAEGQPTCLTVTLLDGMVLARSTFASSMQYRGVMVVGTCAVLEGAEKDHALEVITEHLLPGRWSEARHPSKKELAATLVLALPLDEISVKVSEGPPEDEDDDISRPIWAGTVPLRESFGDPISAPDLVQSYPVPDYVLAWQRPDLA
jgi:nitroimidazol reductase NimA-like FMN-containing flavoprotein (pyridoxamine 5'-phosphate oxidase superfamily)